MLIPGFDVLINKSLKITASKGMERVAAKLETRTPFLNNEVISQTSPHPKTIKKLIAAKIPAPAANPLPPLNFSQIL